MKSIKFMIVTLFMCLTLASFGQDKKYASILYSSNIPAAPYGVSVFIHTNSNWSFFMDYTFGATGEVTPSSTQEVRTGCMCADGTTSTATGSGACSGHGGVAYWLTQQQYVPGYGQRTTFNNINFGTSFSFVKKNNYVLRSYIGVGPSIRKIETYNKTKKENKFNVVGGVLSDFKLFSLGFGFNTAPGGLDLKIGFNF